MIDIRRRRLGVALAHAPLALLAAPASRAQSGKPLFIILTVPPGTSIDALARTLGEKLRVSLNRPVVVESRAGGGGVVAVQHIKRSPDDGSVMLLSPTSAVSMHALFTTQPGFDVHQDLAAVCEVAASPHTITVNRALGVESFPAFVEYLRRHPDKASVGTPSLAGLATLMVYQLSRQLKIDFQTVPYKGGQPLLADLLGNQVPAAASVLADYLPEHRSGRIKVLAHASKERSPLAPDIPTFNELGYPIYEARTTFGMFLRRGTPPSIVQDYARHLTAAVRSPDVVEKLQAIGLTPVGGPPEAYHQVVQNDIRQWGPLIAESGLKIN
ncbi:MAG: hypothetical protein J0H69_23670 [Burkholderiales bacterium]|nr:hypothetical protein [Burkholderiales bacterium]